MTDQSAIRGHWWQWVPSGTSGNRFTRIKISACLRANLEPSHKYRCLPNIDVTVPWTLSYAGMCDAVLPLCTWPSWLPRYLKTAVAWYVSPIYVGFRVKAWTRLDQFSHNDTVNGKLRDQWITSTYKINQGKRMGLNSSSRLTSSKYLVSFNKKPLNFSHITFKNWTSQNFISFPTKRRTDGNTCMGGGRISPTISRFAARLRTADGPDSLLASLLNIPWSRRWAYGGLSPIPWSHRCISNA